METTNIEKSKLIQRLAEILEKNTAETNDVIQLMHFMLDSGDLLSDLFGSRHNNYMYTALHIKELLLSNGHGRSRLDTEFEHMATTANSTVILSGQFAKTISIISAMNDELSSAIDEFNS